MEVSAQKSVYLFYVEGIRCHSCVRKLESLTELESRVFSTHVYFGQNILEAEVASITPEEVKALIKTLGFTSQFIEKEADSFEKQKKSNRALLNKVGVAGFIAGNSMLFSIPIYSGLEEGAYKTIFAYISFFLFLPIVFYCAQDFYKNTIASLKVKTLSIDLPISVALLSGFLFSSYNLFTANYDYLYFDSTASFIFLILSARYLLHRIQQKFIHVNRLLANVEEKNYRLRRLQHEVEIKAKDILPNDILILSIDEIVPVDAIVLDAAATFDTSFLSGESLPQVYQEGMHIKSGSVVKAKQVHLKATHTYKNSGLKQLTEQVESVKRTKGSFVQLADKTAHYLVLTVFAVATIFFVLYASIDVFEAFQRSLALLIVACPCALALGVPLTYALGIKKAQTQDIYIKEQNVFDKILQVTSIFFDKTGTLTKGQLQLKPIQVENDLKNIILNLEKISSHPVAFAFRSAWKDIYSSLPVSEQQEIVGKGVEGVIGQHHYRIESNSQGKQQLFKDGIAIATFEFEDPLREDSMLCVQRLQKSYQTYLLTGDKKASALEIARQVGVDIQKVFFEKNPIEKKQIIEKHSKSLMIGDGVNDTLAIEAAHVGIAVKGSLALSLDHSNVYFLRSGIKSLLDLLTIAKQVRSCLIQNMTISFVYNFIAGAMALLGFINPLTAAILMPISSSVIILNTLRGLR